MIPVKARLKFLKNLSSFLQIPIAALELRIASSIMLSGNTQGKVRPWLSQ